MSETPPQIEFPVDQWGKSGLLWAINRTLLHPHRLALAMTPLAVDLMGEMPEFHIIYGYDHFSPSTNIRKHEDFQAWLKTVKGGFEIIGGQS